MLFLFCFLFCFCVCVFVLCILLFCFCDHRSTAPQLNGDLDQFLKINYAYQWQTSVHMIYIRCHVLIYIIYYLQTGEIVAFQEYTKIIRSESESFDRTRKSNIMIKNRKFYFHIFMQYTNVFISARTNYKTDMKYEIHIL